MMRVVHRLVIVIAFFGALLMWFMQPMSPAGTFLIKPPELYYFLAWPGALAALVIYPIAWIGSAFGR